MRFAVRLWPWVLAVLILAPALAPGYVLSYDMVFVPDLALRSDFLGLGTSLPRAVPSDAVVAVSRQMAADVVDAYPAVDPAKVHVIHNGIDTDEYRRNLSPELMQRHGVDRDPAVLRLVDVVRRLRHAAVAVAGAFGILSAEALIHAEVRAHRHRALGILGVDLWQRDEGAAVVRPALELRQVRDVARTVEHGTAAHAPRSAPGRRTLLFERTTDDHAAGAR